MAMQFYDWKYRIGDRFIGVNELTLLPADFAGLNGIAFDEQGVERFRYDITVTPDTHTSHLIVHIDMPGISIDEAHRICLDAIRT